MSLPDEDFEVAVKEKKAGATGAYFSAEYCSRLHQIIIKLNEDCLKMSQSAAEQHAQAISDKWRIAGLELELATLKAQIFKRRSTDTLPQHARA